MAAGCAGLVLGSLALTAWLDLHPCHLCIFQRLLFMLITILALAATLPVPLVARRLVSIMAALSAAGGMAVSAYQSWLQLQPPDSISCVGGQPSLIERLVEWLGQQVPALFLATGFCEEEELVILWLSLANWAFVVFTTCFAAVVWTLWRDQADKLIERTRA